MMNRASGLWAITHFCWYFGSTAAYGEASAPTLKISGATTMNMYAFHQKKKVNGVKKGYHLANDSSDLIFVIAGKSSNGIEYRYKMSMESLANKSMNVQQNFIEFITFLGTLQIGAAVGPEDCMIQDGSSVMGGTGAFDGVYYKVFQLPSFAMRGNDNIGDTGYNTKIAYYTPFYNNFQFGIAYTPNTSHRGEESYDRRFGSGNDDLPGNRTYMPVKRFNPYGVDVIALGLSYKREFDFFGVNINGAYVHDTSYIPAKKKVEGSKRIRVNDVNAYQLGLILSYRTQSGGLFQWGSGHYNNGKSRLWKKPIREDGGAEAFNIMRHGNSGKAWNTAIGYMVGPYKAGISFQEISRKLHAFGHINKIKTQVLSGTFDLIPLQGLKFYVEGNYIRARSTRHAQLLAKSLFVKEDKKNCNVARENDGKVVIFGTKLSF